MNVKKILSISAVGLTIACFTSIGVLAINNGFSTDQKAVMQGVMKSYYAGKSSINGLAITKDTKISDIFNSDSDFYKKIQGKLNSNVEGKALVNAVNDGASINEILNSSLIYASINKENFDTYKAMTIDIANQLIDIDETSDPALKAAKEKSASDMINASYGTVYFGKDSKGNTVVSLEKNQQIILQINSENAKKLVGTLNSFNSYDEFKNFLIELGIES